MTDVSLLLTMVTCELVSLIVASSANRTWWQSITLYEYKERNLGHMVKSDITLHLGECHK